MKENNLKIIFIKISNTFNAVEENATEIWKFSYFKLIYEHHLCTEYKLRLVPLPSPLSLIDIILVLFRLLLFGAIILSCAPILIICCVCLKNCKQNETTNKEETDALQVVSSKL